MRSIVAWFFIFAGTALMVISTSKPIMKDITAKRIALSGWAGVHRQEAAGDLVSLAYLDDLHQFYEGKAYHFTRPADTGKKNIDLYIYGDSYLQEAPDSAFGHISNYHFARKGVEDLRYTLDPHKRNILIIEDAERFIRPYYQSLEIFDHIRQADGVRASSYVTPSSDPVFFNHDINRNLEFNLFGYRLLDKIKQLKASATYSLFRRTSGDVVVSGNGKYLFLRQTVVPHGPLSSYERLDSRELTQMVEHSSVLYDHYKKDGFDEVYLSFIPNPVTILQPACYNGLIPALQKACAEKNIPVIDVYSIFSTYPDPEKLYRLGDTHWNNNGMQVWLQVVNEALRKESLLHR